MLQTLRSRVVDGWRSLPIPRAGQGESGTRPPLLRQPTVDDASSREPLSPPTWSPPVKYQPSEFVKSRELGRLDPNLYLNETNEDLYDVPLDHLGRVWFTISYDETAEQLRITIHKARNLRAPHHQSLRSSGSIAPSEITTLSLLTPTPTQDCRIRVYIQRSEKKFHATSIKKQTNNPTFEESFTFQLPKHELSNQSIRLDVLSIEKTKRTLLIGYVSFPLAVINQTGSQWRPMRVARDLQLCDSSNVPGNILLVVALTYFPSADRLTVGLFECHNLPLKASGLPINKPVAIVVLGNEMVSKGNGISHWASVMEHPELTVTECHELQPL
uniref:C2 domain-containing protein n=1 Tax=Mesocestoides corti TaxID=53468 RepID=A0A5K3ELV6_MESCO